MKLQRLAFAILCLCLFTGCEKRAEQEQLIMPDIVVAVAPFTQPTQTLELLSGFIPEDQAAVSDDTLSQLDDAFRGKLNSRKDHAYVLIERAALDRDMARDQRGRKSALETWAALARTSGAHMIIVPQIIELHERVGSKAGVLSAASVNEDFYLIDARGPATLIHRTHFAEEQMPLANDITRISSFFRRGGGWVSAAELAAEGMDKAVRELGL
ncbi:MAG: hypothetical protein ACQGQP_06785 [Desulfovibrio sp.]|jgi:hypothetical protein|nr:hypothetical protein [Mailhella sp.]